MPWLQLPGYDNNCRYLEHKIFELQPERLPLPSIRVAVTDVLREVSDQRDYSYYYYYYYD